MITKNDPDKKTSKLWSLYDSQPEKARPMSFWFYFPTEKRAKLAKGVLGKEGFDVDILPPGGPRDNWLCLAYKSMVPEYLEFSDLRK